ncbi:VanZ family protein [Streptomyces sp. NPDC091265]|uniref:VanZ family protein n=2 Tax=Streptomyces TaxID=1883 RepID=UPI003829C7FC
MNAEAESSAQNVTRRKRWGRVLLQVTFLVLAFLAMVGFSVVLAKVTLTPSPASEELVKSNLHPGRSLRQYAEDYTFLAACKQAGGNLLLGMPFGVILPILVPRRLRMIRMVLLTVLVIVVVELVQGALVAGRAFDVDDVILNTTGALLGYLLLGRRLSHRYHVLAERPEAETVPEPAPRTSKREASAAGRDGDKTVPRQRPWQGKWDRVVARTKSGTDANRKAAPGDKSRTRTDAKPRAGWSRKPQLTKTTATKSTAKAGAKPRTVPKAKPKAAANAKSATSTGRTPRGDGDRTGSGRALLDRFRNR